MFTLTHQGTVLARSTGARGEPLDAIEAEPVRYMAAESFKSLYPDAAQR